jgi:hypothetical protein
MIDVEYRIGRPCHLIFRGAYGYRSLSNDGLRVLIEFMVTNASIISRKVVSTLSLDLPSHCEVQ